MQIEEYITATNTKFAMAGSIYRLKEGPNNLVELVDVNGKPTHTDIEEETDRYFTLTQESTEYFMSIVEDELSLRGE